MPTMYNFFVMPEELYKEVNKDIPDGIGCYVYNGTKYGFKIIKKSKRMKIPLAPSQLMHDYLVSCNRDARRWISQE